MDNQLRLYFTTALFKSEANPLVPSTRRPSFSFLVRSGTGQFALFDLGVPGNWLDLVDDPDGYQKEFKTVVAVELVDLLKSEGVDPAKVETVIISRELSF